MTNRTQKRNRRAPSILLRAVVLLAVSAASVVLAAPAPAAAADLVACSPFTDYQPGLGFSFRRCGVPDFDQLRNDLPNKGKMYCVPTSALNWMAYLADRGVSSLAPGPGYGGPFLNDAQDTAISDHIAQMGVLMGTDAFDGTTEGTYDGLNEWLGVLGPQASPFFFAVHWAYPVKTGSTAESPTMSSIVAEAAQGSLTMLNVGWWEPRGTNQWERVGGHMVSLVGGEPAPDLLAGGTRIVINDPASAVADAQGAAHQSPFWPDPHATVSLPGFFKDSSTDMYRESAKALVLGYGNVGLVDGAYFITPKFGLLPDPSSDGFKMSSPAKPDDGGLATIDLGALPGLLDVALAPYGAEHAAVFDGGDIQLLNGVDGSHRTLAAVPGAQRVTYDDHGRLVVLTGDGLVRVHPDGNPDPATRIPVPSDSDEVAFDPAGGRLVGWDRQTGTLTFYGDDLAIVDRQVLPPVLDPGDPAAPVSLSVNSTDGTIGLLADGTNRLIVVSPGSDSGTVHELMLDAGAPLAGLVADSSGLWSSTTEDDNRGVAFDQAGAPLEGTPFDGMRAGRLFRVWQPMNIGEPPEHDFNVLPEDVPRRSPHLEVTSATLLVAAGEDHQVDVALTDDDAEVGGRTLSWTVAGVNSTAGTVLTGPGGTATLTWPGTHPGADHLLVWEDLDGDAAVDPGEPAASQGQSTVAEHLPTTTQAAAAPSPSTVGQAVTVTARVSATNGLPPTGTVTFLDGPTELGAAAVDHDGTASLSTTALAAGPHVLTALYSGDALYAPSETGIPHAVERIATRLEAHPVLARISPLTVTLRLSATLTDASGKPIGGEPVRFQVGGTHVCTGMTDTNGLAVCQRTGLPLLLALLNLGYDATYDGSVTYQPSQSHAPIVG